MALALTTRIFLSIVAKQTNPLDLGTPTFDLVKNYTVDLASGTGANAADRIFTDTRTLAASTTETLDLAGSLVDAFGNTITFARIRALGIFASGANTNNVLVGGNASNQFINWVSDPTDIIIVRPGGGFLLYATDTTGYPVTAGTGDLLKVANSAAGTGVDYDVILIGASA